MPSSILYELDAQGTNAANKVTETRQISATLRDGRKFIIPKAAPFHMTGFELREGSASGNLLIRDKDYRLVLPFEEFNHQMNTQVYGGILFLDPDRTGNVHMTLQALGGEFTLPVGSTVEELTRLTDNILFANWGSVVSVPSGVPVFSHIERLGSVADFGELISALQQLFLLLTGQLGGGSGGSTDGAVATALANHLQSKSAHTPSAVGLGNVKNYGIAAVSNFTVENGQYGNDKYVTPYTVMYAINKFIGERLNTLSNDLNTQKTSLATLSENMQSFTRANETTNSSIESLTQTIQTYNVNYQQVLTAQQETLLALENLQTAVNGYKQALTEYTGQLQSYANQYNNTQQALQDIKTIIEGYEKTIEDYMVQLSKYSDDITAISNRVVKLESQLYATNNVFGAGSHLIRIKPSTKIRITLVGAGAGSGTFIPHQQERFFSHWAERGGDTSLRLLVDPTTGDVAMKSLPEFIAEGGYPGQSTFDGASDIEHYGLGGRGGDAISQSGLFSTVESGRGNDGETGYGSPGTAPTSGAGGVTFYAQVFGRGGFSADRVAGQGGAGAKLVVEINNTKSFELVALIVVGHAGRSVYPEKNNAVDGICLIQSIN